MARSHTTRPHPRHPALERRPRSTSTRPREGWQASVPPRSIDALRDRELENAATVDAQDKVLEQTAADNRALAADGVVDMVLHLDDLLQLAEANNWLPNTARPGTVPSFMVGLARNPADGPDRASGKRSRSTGPSHSATGNTPPCTAPLAPTSQQTPPPGYSP